MGSIVDTHHATYDAQAPGPPLAPQEVMSMLATVLQLPPEAVPTWPIDNLKATIGGAMHSQVWARVVAACTLGYLFPRLLLEHQ